MSEDLRTNSAQEFECKIDSDKLYEVYGSNGNKLYSSDLILNLELGPIEAAQWVVEKLAEAKLADKLTCVVAGAFDVPQENHEWYLRHARYLLAEKYLKINNLEINQESIRDIIESDNIFLVVSIDSDKALDNRKSHDITKGSVKRPIYGWTTRASRIASHNVASQSNPKNRFGIVDLVIAEGPEYEDTILQQAKIFANTLHNNPYCLIDEYVVFDEHPSDIENAIKAGFDPLIVPMSLIYSYDPISGEPYKSSGVIKRIRGEK